MDPNPKHDRLSATWQSQISDWFPTALWVTDSLQLAAVALHHCRAVEQGSAIPCSETRRVLLTPTLLGQLFLRRTPHQIYRPDPFDGDSPRPRSTIASDNLAA